LQISGSPAGRARPAEALRALRRAWPMMRRATIVCIMRTFLLIGAVLAVAAVLFVKHQDQDNRFCVSCHLHQEHFDRMTALHPNHLSAAHFRATGEGHPERCFTCHSGEGVVGWSQVTLLSAWDAARWVVGDRHEPTSMRLPLTNQACLKCHASEIRGTKNEEETSAFHQLANHRGVRTRCVACHVVHARGDRVRTYLDDAVVRRQCQGCHRDLGSD
jgi:nitrate/TMAO reductase-like tetraheme cytochrome c subunit